MFGASFNLNPLQFLESCGGKMESQIILQLI